jgi:hypothetical protein
MYGAFLCQGEVAMRLPLIPGGVCVGMGNCAGSSGHPSADYSGHQ